MKVHIAWSETYGYLLNICQGSILSAILLFLKIVLFSKTPFKSIVLSLCLSLPNYKSAG